MQIVGRIGYYVMSFFWGEGGEGHSGRQSGGPIGRESSCCMQCRCGIHSGCRCHHSQSGLDKMQVQMELDGMDEKNRAEY